MFSTTSIYISFFADNQVLINSITEKIQRSSHATEIINDFGI